MLKLQKKRANPSRHARFQLFTTNLPILFRRYDSYSFYHQVSCQLLQTSIQSVKLEYAASSSGDKSTALCPLPAAG